jgi:hypothetical protein
MLRGKARAGRRRQLALSCVVANVARACTLVYRFRRDVLRGRLLPEKRLNGWLNSLDGAPAVKAKLDRARAHLCERFRWTPAQATRFLLCGETPLVDEVRMRFAPMRPHTALSRIMIEVDPAVTPARLAVAYRERRKHFFAGRRTRAQSGKHLLLAVFVSEYRGPLDGVAMVLWNRSRPSGRGPLARGWSYRKPSVFRRDAKRAYERLLFPDYAAARGPAPT